MTAETIERLLADFRAWLTEHTQEAAAALDAGPPATPVDLATVVGQFTALRHEVNLQTRAVRAQQEQSSQALAALEQALTAVQQEDDQRELAEVERQDELLRPALKTLIDTRDALALAEREIARMRDALTALAPPPAPRFADAPLPPPVVASPRSFWSRLFGGTQPIDAARVQQHAAEQTLAACQRAADEHLRQVADRQAAAFEHLCQSVDSILAGYAMSLQRLDRSIEQHGLAPIVCVGEPFDPELMEVVEVVHDPDRGGTEVLEIIRPGYVWHEKLFRFAQVRVARP